MGPLSAIHQRRYYHETLRKDPVRWATDLANKRAFVARRRRFVNDIKTTCGCVDCGTREGRLDLDHRPNTVKLFNLASPSRSLRAIVAEIEKCDVRCASCHTRRHRLARRAS
jgi:Zn finger protein HypA/HybF involved in hydrogenase expression